MSFLGRRLSDGRAVVLLTLLLFAWTHRYVFELTGFAEDIGHVQFLSTSVASGDIGQQMALRVAGPLWGPGSTMWRPWAYASLCVDAYLYGDRAVLWRISNVLLHALAAMFTGLLAQSSTRSSFAGVVAFSVFLLNPWSAEITLWLVGRFDGWVTAAVTCALWAAWRSRGIDRWLLISAIAGSIAYMSKESALIQPIALLCLIWVQQRQAVSHREPSTSRSLHFFLVIARAIADRFPLVLTHALLLLCYLLIRRELFGSISTDVYASGSLLDVTELVRRYVAHIQNFASIGTLAPISSALATALFFGALISSAFVAASLSRDLVCFAVFWVFVVFLGAALHFGNVSANTDGARLYYLAIVGFSFCAAAVVDTAIRNRWRSRLIFGVAIFLITLAVWQNAVNRQWALAAKEIASATSAIAQEVQALPQRDYGLLLLPDSMGRVPTFRNTQGAIVRAAAAQVPDKYPLDYMVVLLPAQIDEWYQLTGENVLRHFTKREGAPAAPTRYYCKQAGQQNVQPLGFWERGTLEQWRAEWKRRVGVACPAIGF